jgi:hypothetical protein
VGWNDKYETQTAKKTVRKNRQKSDSARCRRVKRQTIEPTKVNNKHKCCFRSRSLLIINLSKDKFCETKLFHTVQSVRFTPLHSASLRFTPLGKFVFERCSEFVFHSFNPQSSCVRAHYINQLLCPMQHPFGTDCALEEYFLRLIKTCPNTFFPYSIDIDENHI